MNRRIAISRLRRLADHLETVPEDQFNIFVWKQESSCGTAACAFGHAASIPSFRKLGLGLQPMQPWPPVVGVRYYLPTYKGVSGMDAAAKFFGIANGEARHLFDVAEYAFYPVTTDKVVERIRSLITRLSGEAAPV